MRGKVLGLLSLWGLLSLFGAKGNKGNPLILTEEDRVLKTLSSFREALNQRDIDGILSFFSKDYQDTSGIKYRDLKGIFEEFFKEVKPEKNYPMFYFYNPRVRIKGDKAEVEFLFIAKGRWVIKKKLLFWREMAKLILKKDTGNWHIWQIRGNNFFLTKTMEGKAKIKKSEIRKEGKNE